MKDYVNRMIEEEKELAERINKLSAFLEDKTKSENISCLSFSLMAAQLHAMTTYEVILMQRIKLEEENPNLKTLDSPTNRIGGEVLTKFTKVTHKEKIRILTNARK